MNVESQSTRIIKLHKKWADGLTLIWQLIVLILFGGTYVLLDHVEVSAADRNSMLILLTAMAVIAAIWQGLGLGIARVHMIFDGVPLEQKVNRRDRP
jgi:hypothetical protein